ncbi:MAG: CooT family nickel-binding protein [Clostridia bacterium]|nr:CooT family nickel-binding protein [Clostridia bacterium]NCC42676.1 CooT family nickel-binding protein [Clostridia bacterium]
MCLATVYKEEDDTVICRNVSKILVEGKDVIIRDIMGEEITVEGNILMVDLANSIVKLECK